MMMMTIAFLIFYVLIVSSKLFSDYASRNRASKSELLSYSRVVADQISTTITNTVSWINNGIDEGNNPAQSARLMALSPGIDAAAILGPSNEIIASYPVQSNYLSNVVTADMEENAIKVTSLIDPDGRITTLIVKKTGLYYAVAALPKNSLIDTSSDLALSKFSLVDANARVIAGDNNVGKLGVMQAFNLPKKLMKELIISKDRAVHALKINGNKYHIACASVPNTSLSFLVAKQQNQNSILKSNVALFLALFLGTSALVWMLLRSLFSQLKSIRHIQQQTEISQQRFRAAAEGDKGGVWEIDLANNKAYISASLSGLLGLPKHEHKISVSQFLNLFHPQDRERFLSFARRTHIKGEFEFDIRVARHPIILQCNGKQSTRVGNSIKRVIVGVALNITEQRRAQARLKATEGRLHNALSSMTDSFAVWDSMNRLVIWNRRFADFLQFKPGDLRPGMDHASVEYLAKPAIIDVINFNDQPGVREMKLSDNRWIRYIETQTADGGHVSIGTDITELRLREADLRNNENALQNTINVLRKSQANIVELAGRYESEKIRAEEASQSKSTFLANMSHELRTPLNAINGFSDIMKKEMFGPLGDERYKEYISDILFSGQHLLALINDILDMSKIEAGKMALNSEVMFMHEMISQVVRIIRGRAESAQLALDISVKEIRAIEADPRAVKQVLLNLITNAIKFTPEGGRVTVELIEKKTGIIVKVKDTGIGISQENIDRLVKPFEQVIDKSSQNKEGTGLGLALSRSLIELHGGNFKIESVLGKGTTIIFSLPNKPIEQKEQQQDDVTQEISRLADDISKILGDTPENTDTEIGNGSPYPYQVPGIPLPDVNSIYKDTRHEDHGPHKNRPAA
jgi:two-component system cell cycle sensor histidine kinase PleC